MSETLVVYIVSVGLFVAMVICTLVGREIGRRRVAPERAGYTFGVIDGAVFGLLGLLIAFTFSGAASRFDARRQLVAEEINAISTAYRRLDLLPADLQPELRHDFGEYIGARLAVYRKLPDMEASEAELARSRALHREIWRKAVVACKNGDGQHTCPLLLPALNEMLDVATARTVALHNHTPWIIFVLLAVVSLAGSLLVGDAIAEGTERSWIHAIIFALVLALTIHVILDLEYPRAGLIRIQGVEQMLEALLGSAN